MSSTSRWSATASVGVLLLLCVPAPIAAQVAAVAERGTPAVATIGSGTLAGVVQDEKGAPVAGALVSAVGATSSVAITDRGGKFEMRTLSPGPYLVRAHVSGFAGSRGQVV